MVADTVYPTSTITSVWPIWVMFRISRTPEKGFLIAFVDDLRVRPAPTPSLILFPS